MQKTGLQTPAVGSDLSTLQSYVRTLVQGSQLAPGVCGVRSHRGRSGGSNLVQSRPLRAPIHVDAVVNDWYRQWNRQLVTVVVIGGTPIRYEIRSRTTVVVNMWYIGGCIRTKLREAISSQAVPRKW
jgi:hypothetical protein